MIFLYFKEIVRFGKTTKYNNKFPTQNTTTETAEFKGLCEFKYVAHNQFIGDLDENYPDYGEIKGYLNGVLVETTLAFLRKYTLLVI